MARNNEGVKDVIYNIYPRAIITLSIVLLLMWGGCQIQSGRELREQLREINREKEQYKAKIKELESVYLQLDKEYTEVKAELDSLYSHYQNLPKDVKKPIRKFTPNDSWEQLILPIRRAIQE